MRQPFSWARECRKLKVMVCPSLMPPRAKITIAVSADDVQADNQKNTERHSIAIALRQKGWSVMSSIEVGSTYQAG